MFDRLQNTISELFSGNTLKARTARGSFWLGIGSSAEQSFRLLRNILLTRILAPETFGVMAIVLAVNTFFESFSEIGIKEAVIQSPNGDAVSYLNGVWFLSIGRSLLLYLIAWIGAPFIARFYHNPDLVAMMRIVFLSMIFRGLMSPNAYVTVKKMKFQKWIMVEQLGGIIGIITAIILAFFNRNVWALLIGFTVEAFSIMILSFIFCPFKPRFVFQKDHLRSLLKFAGGMFGLPILTFIFMRIDVFVIGKLNTAAELGLYSMAVSLARVPSLFVEKFISPLLMPVFSQMQNDSERINKVILNISSLFAFMGIPLIVLVIFYNQPMLSVIYTSQYVAVAVPFTILFIAMIIRNFNVPIVSLYLAIGHPELIRLFTGLRAALVMVFIYPAVKYFGLIGAASSILVSVSIAYIFQIIRLKKLVHLDLKKYLSTFLPSLLVSVCIVIVWGVTHWVFKFSIVIDFLFGIIGLLIAYAFSLLLLLGNKNSFVYKKYLQIDGLRSKGTNMSRENDIIWIDLDNTPHVPFFVPIINELKERRYKVIVTVRDCFQVCELADLSKLSYVKVGRHYGKSIVLKFIGLLVRTAQLAIILRKLKPSVAVSHGSRAQLLLARLRRIPAVLIDDYEHSKLTSYLRPKMIIMPESISNSAIKGNHAQIVKYPGIKEDVYVPYFKPDPQIIENLGISGEEIIVTVRPPATEAHYSNPDSEELFKTLIEYLQRISDVRIILLPRNQKQMVQIKRTWHELFKIQKIIIPRHVVNGLNLIWYSDLVVSGGGTMNRESAALGVPVYSIFKGKIGAVDKYLSENGRLVLIEDIEDINKKIKLIKRAKPDCFYKYESNTMKIIVDAIEKSLPKIS